VKLLLDTHAVIWWFIDSPRLPDHVKDMLDDPGNTVSVSAASAWEVATKFRKGHLPEAAELALNFPSYVRDWNFESLAITVVHGHRAGLLPGSHKDPFDRMLVAQAIIEGMDLVSSDQAMAQLGARVLW
jgi:PIN domain nuclease of toxin-antitoxin system